MIDIRKPMVCLFGRTAVLRERPAGGSYPEAFPAVAENHQGGEVFGLLVPSTGKFLTLSRTVQVENIEEEV